jgi:uncharacterized protein YegP (UPF0339 family)
MKTVWLYRRDDGLWDWRLTNDGNHQIEATSGGQGFTERNDAAESIARVFGSQYPIQYELFGDEAHGSEP